MNVCVWKVKEACVQNHVGVFKLYEFWSSNMLSYIGLASYEHFLVDRYRGRLVLKLCMTF